MRLSFSIFKTFAKTCDKNSAQSLMLLRSIELVDSQKQTILTS